MYKQGKVGQTPHHIRETEEGKNWSIFNPEILQSILLVFLSKFLLLFLLNRDMQSCLAKLEMVSVCLAINTQSYPPAHTDHSHYPAKQDIT